MTRPSKRKQFLKKLANQREAQRKIRKILHENDTSYNAQDPGWESEEKEEQDAVAIGLIQGSADSESDESEDDEVIVSEGEELEQADESAFGLLMASAARESRYVRIP
jgi:hypothetical protein